MRLTGCVERDAEICFSGFRSNVEEEGLFSCLGS